MVDNTKNSLTTGIEGIIQGIFGASDLDAQPRYLFDVGGYVPEFSATIYDTIANKTERGRVLGKYPIEVIIFNVDADAATKLTDQLENIPHRIIHVRDLSNESLRAKCREMEISDPESGLFLCTNAFHDSKKLISTLGALQTLAVTHGLLMLQSYQSTEIDDVELIENNLAYISPEQTGRANRPVDYRSDFYTLGITLYEILTGQVPCTSDDPIEYIYFHLTLTPPPPHEINERIPVMLSNIVSKCLAKDPRERYNSSIGLKADLQHSYNEWTLNQKIEQFTLGEKDVYEHLNISAKVYGRDQEVKQLIELFEQTLAGDNVNVMITGYSGIGKTSLVNVIQRPIVNSRSSYAAGKFDQLQRNTPYTAFTQIIDSLTKHWLTESENKLVAIKESLLSALGDSAQVIIDVFPCMARILGDQPAIEKLAAEQSLNRFLIYFQKMIECIASKEHPLVFFIDDLQWIDPASMKLLDVLVTDTNIQYLMLIGTYRDNEVDDSHPLKQLFNRVGHAIDYFQIKPLTANDYSDLISDSLRMSKDKVQPLAKAIFKKTDGNPFFAKQFLYQLHETKLLTFSHTHGCWTWNIASAMALPSTDNVIELMITRIHNISENSQKLLKVASCIGVYFEIDTLALQQNITPSKTMAGLWDALNAGLIYRIESADKYKFFHDRVQQAAYNIIPAKEKNNINLSIGRLLLHNIPNLELSDRLFEVIDHFMTRAALIEDVDEKRNIARLTMHAVERAKQSAAFQSAYEYIQLAYDLQNNMNWKDDFEMKWQIQSTYLKTLYLIGMHDDIVPFAEKLLKQAQSNLEKVDIYLILIRHYEVVAEHAMCYQVCRRAMLLLGVNLPQSPTKSSVKLELYKFKWHYLGKDLTQALTHLKPTETQSAHAISELAMYTVLPALYTSTTHLAQLVLSYINHASKEGVDPHGVALILANLAYVLLLTRFRFEEVEPIITAAKYYNQHHSTPSVRAYSGLWLGIYDPYFDRINDQTLNDLANENWECGNLTQALTCRVSATRHTLMTGQPLSALSEAVDANQKLSNKISQLDWIEYFKLYQKHANHLQLKSENSLEILRQQVNTMRKSPNVLNRFHALTVYCRSLWFAEEYPDKGLYNELFDNYMGQLTIYATSWETWLYYHLALCTWYKEAGYFEKLQYRRRMRFVEKKLKYVADQCPTNYRQFYMLAVAERFRLDNKILSALDTYDYVIQLATENSFPQFAALANERAGQFCLEIHRKKFAIQYLHEAAYQYQEWGCQLKLKLLAERYEYLQLNIHRDATNAMVTHATTTTSLEQLDLQALLKATKVVFSEIILIKLLEKMLRIIIENSAANRAVFIDLTGIEDTVIAEMIVKEHSEKFTEHGIPLDSFDEVPRKIIHYTKRVKSTVVTSDATESTLFNKDDYIKKYQCKSVLCLPILRKNRLIGLIYLENRKVNHIFTRKRTILLETLASEIAVSYENSQYFARTQKLYKSTERFVPKRFLKLLNKENIEEVELGDTTKKIISVVFTDIRNFTTLVENSTPEEAFAFSNRYWKFMAPVIYKYNGYIDQFQGDAVLAVFASKDANYALMSAIEMLSTLEKFNQKQHELGQEAIDIGVGVSTGPAMLGILGDQTRQVPGLISDVANTAARIEGLNKARRTHILFSNTTYTAITPDNYTYRLIDRVYLKGKTLPTDIYEIIDWQNTLTDISFSDYLQKYEAAFAFYRSGKFSEAIDAFKDCLRYFPEDGSLNILLLRCQQFLEQGAPKDWDGAFTLTTK